MRQPVIGQQVDAEEADGDRAQKKHQRRWFRGSRRNRSAPMPQRVVTASSRNSNPRPAQTLTSVPSSIRLRLARRFSLSQSILPIQSSLPTSMPLWRRIA